MKTRNMLRSVGVILCLALLLSAAAPGFAAPNDVVAQGKCGDDLSWVLTEDQTLTISGSGEMWDFTAESMPWYDDLQGIDTVVIEQGVTSIGAFAFYECVGLRSFRIPSSVKRIGDCCFTRCEYMKSAAIPDGVEYIGYQVFQECYGLASASIPASVSFIGSNIFLGCWNLTAIRVDVSNPYYKSVDGVLFDKSGETLHTCPGGKTGAYTIPDGVKTILEGAFCRCKQLTSITIPESVTDIGVSAFGLCTGLSSVTIPDGLTILSPCLFQGCENLRTVHIPDSVKTIARGTFLGCKSLTFVKIPDSAAQIDADAFADCARLAYIAVGKGVKSIGVGAFDGCLALLEIYYAGTQDMWRNDVKISAGNAPLLSAMLFCDMTPDSVIAAGSCGDDASWSLTLSGALSVTGSGGMWNFDYDGAPWLGYAAAILNASVREGITEISAGTFAFCENLLSVSIPESVAEIGELAFIDCLNLTQIEVAAGNPNYKSVDGVLFDKAGQTLLAWPGGRGGLYLVPLGVKTIGTYAFAFSWNLTAITFPGSVTAVQDGAFLGCSALTDVYYAETERQWAMLSIGKENEPLLNAEIHFGSTGPAPDPTRGDMDGDGRLTSDDAIRLLRHVLQPELYPVRQRADVDGDGLLTTDDAIYLLRHTLLPWQYPLR